MTDTSKKQREFNIGVISEWPFQITILQSDFDYDNNPEALKTMGCVRNIRAIEMKAYQSLQAEIEYLKRMLADERSGDSDKDKTIRRLKSNNQALQSLLEQCEKLEMALEKNIKVKEEMKIHWDAESYSVFCHLEKEYGADSEKALEEYRKSKGGGVMIKTIDVEHGKDIQINTGANQWVYIDKCFGPMCSSEIRVKCDFDSMSWIVEENNFNDNTWVERARFNCQEFYNERYREQSP